MTKDHEINLFFMSYFCFLLSFPVHFVYLHHETKLYSIMKQFILFILTFILFFTANAQNLNRYKSVVIKESPDGNYGIPQRLGDYLKKKGFAVLNVSDEISQEDIPSTLFCTYRIIKSYNGDSELAIYFKDSFGKIEMELHGAGCALSINGDMKIALRKAIIPLEELKYNYTPLAISSEPAISENDVKEYLSSNSITPIEGIYKSIGTDIYYRIAITKLEGKYVAKILDTNSPYWKNGATKAILEPIRQNLFSTTYYMGDRSRTEIFSSYTNGILEMMFNDNSKSSYIKLFPNEENLSQGGSSEENTVTEEVAAKATGSGFFISSNIIATNFHVIEDASKIEVWTNDGTTKIGYKARVLCSDKKNDVALVSIVDKSFKGVSDIPYAITRDNFDVGTSIFTMGYPMSNLLGEEVKITDGIISSKTGFLGDVGTYQISAPIQPGNSGGGLFDINGKLVGITNASVVGAENVNYAIKVPYLIELIENAPIIIDLPEGKNLNGKKLPELVKFLSPYVVFIKIY